MSWPQWPVSGASWPTAGASMPAVPSATAPITGSTLSGSSTIAGTTMSTPTMPNAVFGAPYTPEQWAALLQQNWQEWTQWQQQYQQWQAQYGEQYQKSMSALTGQSVQLPMMPVQPPLPPTENPVPPPLPETKPPLPPDDPPTTLQSPQNMPNFSVPPPNFNQSSMGMQTTAGNYNTIYSQANQSSTHGNFSSENTSGNNASNLINTKFSARNQNYERNLPSNQGKYPASNYNSPGTPMSLMSLVVPKPGYNDLKRSAESESEDESKKQRFDNTRQWNQKNYGKFGMENQSSYTTFGNSGNQGATEGNQYSRRNNEFNSRPGSIGGNREGNQFTRRGSQNFNHPSSAERRPNIDALLEAERNFDKQFEDWEEQFNKWKSQNAGHPDKQQYKEYEAKWESWRAQLLERREQMRRKRLGLMGSDASVQLQTSLESEKQDSQLKMNLSLSENSSPSVQTTPTQSATPSATVSKDIPRTSTPNLEKSISKPFKIVEAENLPENLSILFKLPPKEQRTNVRQRALPSKSDEFSQDADFLRVNTSGGIPGLDLVEKEDKPDEKENEIIEIPDDSKDETVQKSPEKQGPDLEAISKGINNILGDEKLLSMLSMVTQKKTIEDTKPQMNENQGMKELSSSNFDNQQKSTFDNRQNPNYDKSGFDNRISSSFDNQSNVGFENRPIPGFDNRPNHGFDNQLNSSFENRSNTGFDNRPNSGFDNRPNPGLDNRPNLGFDNRPNPGFGPNLGFDNRSNPGFGNRPNPGFDNRPNPGFDNRPNTGFDNRPNPGFDNRPNPGFDNRPNPGFDNRPNLGFDNRMFPNFDNRAGFDRRPHSNFDNRSNSSFDNRPYSNQYDEEFNDNGEYSRDSYDRDQQDDEYNEDPFAHEDNEDFQSNNFQKDYNQDRGSGYGSQRNFGSDRGNFDSDRNFDAGFSSGGFGRNERGHGFNRTFGNVQGPRGFDNFTPRGFDMGPRGFDGPRFNNNFGSRGLPFGPRNRFPGPPNARGQPNEPIRFPPRPGARFGFPPENVNEAQKSDNTMSDQDNFSQERPLRNDDCRTQIERPNLAFPNDRDPNLKFGRDNRFPGDNRSDIGANLKMESNFGPNGPSGGRTDFGPLGKTEFDANGPPPVGRPDFGPSAPPQSGRLDYGSNGPPLAGRPDFISKGPPSVGRPEFAPNAGPGGIVRKFTSSFQESDPDTIDETSRDISDYDQNSQSMEDFDNRSRSSIENRRNKGPNSYNEKANFNTPDIPPRPSNPMRDRHLWDEALILRPATVVDYNHKSLRREENFIEPVQTFDYGHTSSKIFAIPDPPKISSSKTEDKYSTYSYSRNRDRKYNDELKNRQHFSNFNNSHRDKMKLEDRSDNFPNKSVSDTMKIEKPSSITLIQDLLMSPGRNNRPPRLVIIMRGPPGSGKTFLAKLIKDKEVEQGGSAPRILSLDDYFMVETEKEVIEDGRKTIVKDMTYEYEECMETAYRNSLEKVFKKTITDGYFQFIILDCVNDKIKHFSDMWSFAKQNGFQVYVCQMELDVANCTKRNIHHRSEVEIERLVAGWEETPSHYLTLDATSLLQSGCISEVEMEEVSDATDNEDDDDEGQIYQSKWEKMDHTNIGLAKLDGTAKPLRHSKTMEDYLQFEDDVIVKDDKPGQKRVRWADLEEKRSQDKMRAIGFVVGQTDWNRMMDPTQGQSALTQTKYIERVRKF